LLEPVVLLILSEIFTERPEDVSATY
jgi:hypothetical protein